MANRGRGGHAPAQQQAQSPNLMVSFIITTLVGVLESLIRRLRADGVDVTGWHLLPQAVRTELDRLVRSNTLTLPALEAFITASVETMIRDARLKQGLRELVDVYFDEVRTVMDDTAFGGDPRQRESTVRAAAGRLQGGLGVMAATFSKQKAGKPSFAALLMDPSVSDQTRYTLIAWEKALEPQPADHRRWMRAREAIDKPTVINFVAELPAEDRLVFLEMAYWKEPTMWEILLAVLRGEPTPWTDELRTRIQAWKTGAEELYRDMCAEEEKILRRNGLGSGPAFTIVWGRRELAVVQRHHLQIVRYAVVLVALVLWLISKIHP